MNKPHKVRCLDAIYDEDDGVLVMNLFFEDIGEKRIMTWHKQDFTYKGHKEVPDIEMHRTSRIIRGKQFFIVVEDDPDREKMTTEDQMRYAVTFNKRISQEMDNVEKGMTEESGQIQRRLYRLAEEGKLDVSKLIENEKQVRNKIGLE